MHYRIALCGFSAFEHRALHFSFQNPASAYETAYDVVEALSEADFAVVDADSSPAVKGVVLSGRLPHSVFVGVAAPSGVGSHLPRPIDPTRIRRALDGLAMRYPEPRARLEPPPDSVLPTLEDEIALPPAPPEPSTTNRPTTAVAPASVEPSAASAAGQALAAAKHAAKVAARAAARRRLAGDGRGASAAEPLRDVLVLDSEELSGTLLCTLLERFGFDAMHVRSIPQAAAQLGRRNFAAYFLDATLDGEGLMLVQRIHEIPAPEGHPTPAVLLVCKQLNPADRVRAALAGIQTPLLKPVSRGDVARALEACGVVLPDDARRH